jgi:hypothetical protein
MFVIFFWRKVYVSIPLFDNFFKTVYVTVLIFYWMTVYAAVLMFVMFFWKNIYVAALLFITFFWKIVYVAALLCDESTQCGDGFYKYVKSLQHIFESIMDVVELYGTTTIMLTAVVPATLLVGHGS